MDNDADCDDQDPSVNPDGTEVCDGVDADEDCEGPSDLLVGAYGLNSGAGAAYLVFGGGLYVPSPWA